MAEKDDVCLDLIQQYKKCQNELETHRAELRDEQKRREGLMGEAAKMREQKHAAEIELEKVINKMHCVDAELKLCKIAYQSHVSVRDKGKENLSKLREERDNLLLSINKELGTN